MQYMFIIFHFKNETEQMFVSYKTVSRDYTFFYKQLYFWVQARAA